MGGIRWSTFLRVRRAHVRDRTPSTYVSAVGARRWGRRRGRPGPSSSASRATCVRTDGWMDVHTWSGRGMRCVYVVSLTLPPFPHTIVSCGRRCWGSFRSTGQCRRRRTTATGSSSSACHHHFKEKRTGAPPPVRARSHTHAPSHVHTHTSFTHSIISHLYAHTSTTGTRRGRRRRRPSRRTAPCSAPPLPPRCVRFALALPPVAPCIEHTEGHRCITLTHPPTHARVSTQHSPPCSWHPLTYPLHLTHSPLPCAHHTAPRAPGHFYKPHHLPSLPCILICPYKHSPPCSWPSPA